MRVHILTNKGSDTMQQPMIMKISSRKWSWAI